MTRLISCLTILGCVAAGACSSGLAPDDSSQVDAAADGPGATIAYVGRVGGVTGSGSSAALAVTGAGVSAGHDILIALLLTSSSAGAVTASDGAGNAYTADVSFGDGGKNDRVVILSSLGVKALAGGSSISLAFPSAKPYHLVVDEFAGVTVRDQSKGASGSKPIRDFSSGVVVTAQSPELLYGAVGIETATSLPTWVSPWMALPLVSNSSDHLSTAYSIVSMPGNYAALGTAPASDWMAGISTYR